MNLILKTGLASALRLSRVERREMRQSGSPFDILDLLAILREHALIQPINPGSSQCEACGRLHFRQWFRASGGYQFYVCTVARHAMFHDLATGWRLVTLHDLVRWLLSSLAAARAA